MSFPSRRSFYVCPWGARLLQARFEMGPETLPRVPGCPAGPFRLVLGSSDLHPVRFYLGPFVVTGGYLGLSGLEFSLEFWDFLQRFKPWRPIFRHFLQGSKPRLPIFVHFLQGFKPRLPIFGHFLQGFNP